jgi:TolB-like protein/DNA-binding winged helix-turn-helix (wHTH) protein/Tfp pilus assembly protein PilF
MPADRQYCFGAFRLDAGQRALFRGEDFIPMAPKLLETLKFLVERHGRIVDKQDLIDAVWRGVVIEEAGLARNVSELRKILATGGDTRSFIETVPKRGYRFVAVVTEQLERESVDAATGTARTSTTMDQARMERTSQPRATPAAGHEPAQTPPTVWVQSQSSQRRRIVLLAIAILASASGVLFWQRMQRQEPVNPHRPMLVILPVQNLTGDRRHDYIGDGMTEELITKMGSLDPERIGVIARTSSMAYKRTTKTAGQIGRELGADYVLEGSLRGNTQRTRFTVQLVRTSDQSHLWARDYDRDSQDLLALEDEIGDAVAREIDARLTTKPAKRETAEVKPASHEDYLLGRYYWNQGDDTSLRRSIELYRRALEKDPKNALAYAGLADAYSALSDFYLPPRAVMPEARAAALNAVQLDESLSAAHNALCVVFTTYEWNWSAADRECRRAIELNPNSSDAHDSYGMLLAYIGRFAEAAAEIRHAEALDPFSFRIYCDGAFIAFLAHDYKLAEEQAKRSIDLAPDYFLMRSYLALIYVQMRKNDEAVAEAEQAARLTGSPLIKGWLGYVYAATGRATEARRIADALIQLRTRSYVCAFEIGTTELSLGHRDEAFRWFEAAYEDRSLCITSMKFDPRLDTVRSDARYRSLIQRVGFPD